MSAPEPSLDERRREFHALIGDYLWHWSAMEGLLNNAIGKVLGLDSLQKAIVCSNITLKNKIDILKTALSLEPISLTERKQFVETLESIRAASNERNMIAHDAFDVSEDRQRLEWFVRKAKGKLTFPDSGWTKADFESRFSQIDTFSESLEKLHSALGCSSLIKEMTKSETVPKTMFGALGVPSLLSPQFQVDHKSDTNPSNAQGDEQTPPPSE